MLNYWTCVKNFNKKRKISRNRKAVIFDRIIGLGQNVYYDKAVRDFDKKNASKRNIEKHQKKLVIFASGCSTHNKFCNENEANRMF